MPNRRQLLALLLVQPRDVEVRIDQAGSSAIASW